MVWKYVTSKSARKDLISLICLVVIFAGSTILAITLSCKHSDFLILAIGVHPLWLTGTAVRALKEDYCRFVRYYRQGLYKDKS